MGKGQRIFLASLLAVSFLLVGCGKKSSDGETITIWHDKEDAVADVLQTELDKLAPDIKVRLEKKNGLTESLKMVGKDSKAAPDMYFFAHDKIGVYAEMGILSPITDFADKQMLDDYLDMTISAATYKGEIYQLPIYFETLLYMYNRALMYDDQVPETTEELYTFMKEHTLDDKYGFVEQHSTAYYSAGWIHGFGSELISEDAQPMLNEDKTKQALEYHLKFTKLMPGESEYTTVNTLFLEGHAASTINGPWFVPSAREAGINLGIAPMPVVDETGLQLAPYSGVQGLHVLKVAAEDEKKHEAIKKILNYLIQPDVGIKMASASGCAPAYKECYENEKVKNDEMVMMMRKTAETAVPMPNIPAMDVMWNVTGNMLVDINMSGTDIETATDTAQEKATELIKAME